MSNELMQESQKLFFDLLHVCIGARDTLQRQYTEKEWGGALKMAQEQTMTGVLMSALERLPKEQLPSKFFLLQWIGLGEIVVDNSNKLFNASQEVLKYFHENGFACHILKGSSVARYYPIPNRRASGDVDVWLDGTREEIYNFARKFDKDKKLYGVNYHHIHFHLIDDVHIEVHIWPSFLSSPIRNWMLHKFCDLHRPTMGTDMPSLAFNRVFIMLHCYRHMCGHGLGLRQIMDYFYVLKQSYNDNDNLNPNDNWREDTVKWIKKLGMARFATGLMWVLQVYFGLESQYLLMKPDEKEGRFIIEEVLQTGNMGHSDTRNWGSTKTPLSRFFYNLRRDAYLAKHYPHEALWQPFFSLWLYAWRLSKGLMKDRDE